MKKLILVAALLFGGCTILTSTITADNAAQVCDMNRPCVYQGGTYGTPQCSGSAGSPAIQVYYSKDTGDFVAVIGGDMNDVAYCLYDRDNDVWYVNTKKNERRYFKM